MKILTKEETSIVAGGIFKGEVFRPLPGEYLLFKNTWYATSSAIMYVHCSTYGAGSSWSVGNAFCGPDMPGAVNYNNGAANFSVYSCPSGAGTKNLGCCTFFDNIAISA